MGNGNGKGGKAGLSVGLWQFKSGLKLVFNDAFAHFMWPSLKRPQNEFFLFYFLGFYFCFSFYRARRLVWE